MIAGLEPPIDALAARLRLRVERSWEDLGEVDAAVFSVERLQFTVSLMTYGQAESWVWLHRAHEDADAALAVLLRALGPGRDAVAFTGGPDPAFTTSTLPGLPETSSARRWQRAAPARRAPWQEILRRRPRPGGLPFGREQENFLPLARIRFCVRLRRSPGRRLCRRQAVCPSRRRHVPAGRRTGRCAAALVPPGAGAG
ncbi:hypothetical protein AB0D08_37595 [Kitasatospora sp. NPDC048540]|uniref:hypothetical protein n=1 Tax=Kitasatospora sp. NPDC048540 TaxID=3155634 RepID=UPI0033EA1320